MRLCLLIFSAGVLFGQQPILYSRGAVNAASLAPPGLPNAAIARGSAFSVFGENLGPAQSPALAFPLSTSLGGVSLSVTQGAVTTPVFPTFVSAGQINAILPSTVKAGLATLRLTYQSRSSNAITIQVADSAPGIFAVSSGGYGPGIVQNFVSNANQPINSSVVPASPGQVITIWGTGLGPVTFPDNVAPTAGDVAASVTVTIGGRVATKLYSGRTPCCSGIDQIAVNVPADAPLGCWVPVRVTAGGVVSNTVTMAIAAAGATSCDDPGNPVSKLVRTAGTQAFIQVEQSSNVDNTQTASPVNEAVTYVYSRFYTRPGSPFSFDPYMSYPPAGSCLVHQTSGNANDTLSLRGALPPGASLSPQPAQSYFNGTQSTTFSPTGALYAGVVGGLLDSTSFGLSPPVANASFTVDPSGPNRAALSLTPEPGVTWNRSSGILVVSRGSPLTLTFTPGDAAAPTAISLNAYSAGTNSTVEVQCLAAPGAGSFTIPAEALANLPTGTRLLDGSYATLYLATLGLNHAVSFTNGLAANGVLLNSNWVSQTVVLQ